MDGSVRGMPLIADEAPAQGDDSECRRCGKGFVPLIVRSRKCAHCGFSYCHSCSDHSALRQRPDATGYETVHVCSYCIDNLTLTSAPRNALKQQSIAKLKHYLSSYGIPIPPGLAEKNDLVDLVLSSRVDGVMPPDKVRYYRRNSIPRRRASASQSAGGAAAGLFEQLFGDGDSGAQRPPPPPRPQQQRPQQSRQPPPQTRQQQRPTPTSGRPPQPQPQQRYAPPSYPPPPRQQQRPTQPSTRPQAQPRVPNPARPATPTMDDLVSMSSDELSHLSISALKSVLEHNHVNTHLLVEKADLVSKVVTLVEQEKRERDRLHRLHEMEAEQERVREQEMDDIRRAEAASRETHERERDRRMQAARTETEGHPGVVIEVDEAESPATAEESSEPEHDMDHLAPTDVDPEQAAAVPLPSSPLLSATSTSPSTPSLTSTDPPPLPPKSDFSPAPSPAASKHKKPNTSNVEYDLSLIGRCVVCQDEEANIAIVDCGHLALCMPCSDLIMKSTRECPLCRTRIVTEQRLLRIYRT